MYVQKCKCSNYVTPKKADVCKNALAFYDKVDKIIEYPRLAVAQGNIYYNYSYYTTYNPGKNTPKNIQLAQEYFNQAIDSKVLAEFEVLKLKTRISELNKD